MCYYYFYFQLPSGSGHGHERELACDVRRATCYLAVVLLPLPHHVICAMRYALHAICGAGAAAGCWALGTGDDIGIIQAKKQGAALGTRTSRNAGSQWQEVRSRN
jgi:hypothetical protein